MDYINRKDVKGYQAETGLCNKPAGAYLCACLPVCCASVRAMCTSHWKIMQMIISQTTTNRANIAISQKQKIKHSLSIDMLIFDL